MNCASYQTPAVRAIADNAYVAAVEQLEIPGAQVIPLRRRDGTVRAYALVDPEDFARLGHYRWYLSEGKDGDYVIRNVPAKHRKQTKQSLHRAVMGLGPGDPGYVDHRNHNTLDNRKTNLRLCTNAENAQNRKGAYSSNRSSGLRGVHFRKDKKERPWQGAVRVAGARHHVGYFVTKKECGEAVAAKRRELMPFATN